MLDRTPDQSFSDYVSSRPNRADAPRNIIYLLPICEPHELTGPEFPEGTWPSWEVLETAVATFYAPLAVRTLPSVPMAQLQVESRDGSWGVRQYHAGQVLESMIRRKIP